MKKLILIVLVCLMSSVGFEAEAGGKDRKRDYKEKKHKKWKKRKSKKRKKKTIPIDGGLSLFLLAGGAVGVAALRKKKVV